MWGISPRAIFLAAGVAAVLGVGWLVLNNEWNKGFAAGRAEGDREVRKMYEAGQKAMAKRQTVITELKGKSREDANRIARLSRDARVYLCPTPNDGMPGDFDPSTTGADRAGRIDIAPILRQFLRTAGEVNRALE